MIIVLWHVTSCNLEYTFRRYLLLPSSRYPDVTSK